MAQAWARDISGHTPCLHPSKEISVQVILHCVELAYDIYIYIYMNAPETVRKYIGCLIY